MKILKIAFTLLLCANMATAQTYLAGDANSKVGFSIKNFASRVGGSFTGLKGTIIFNPKALTSASINVSVNSNTISTGNGSRDKHLRKEEYFNVDKFPLLTFVSTKISESTIAGRFFVVGNLTIKGVTKSVQFGFTATAIGDEYKFVGEFELNRRDFGVGGSSVIMSDKLNVSLNITAKK
jgi:polyisoprenoid-binding protein YceI